MKKLISIFIITTFTTSLFSAPSIEVLNGNGQWIPTATVTDSSATNSILQGSATTYLNVNGSTQTKSGGLIVVGNVGIGTSSASSKLHVVGTMTVTEQGHPSVFSQLGFTYMPSFGVDVPSLNPYNPHVGYGNPIQMINGGVIVNGGITDALWGNLTVLAEGQAGFAFKRLSNDDTYIFGHDVADNGGHNFFIYDHNNTYGDMLPFYIQGDETAIGQYAQGTLDGTANLRVAGSLDTAVHAEGTNTGVYGNANVYGLYGNGNYGVYGNGFSYGGYFTSSLVGVDGNGGNYGVYGYASSNNGVGVYGGANMPGGIGVQADGNAYSLYAGNAPSYFAGNVGIGSAGPNYNLDISGNVNVTGGYCINGDCKTSWSGGGGSQWNDGAGYIYYNAGNVAIGVNWTGNGALTSISNSGNYGVYGSAGQQGVYGSGNNAGVYGDGSNYGVVGRGSNTGVFAHSDGNQFDFYADNPFAKSFFNGNVGIGTENPSYKLDINGYVNAVSGYCINGNCINNWGGGGGGYWSNSGMSDIYSNNSGNVGIGSSYPYYGKIDVEGGGGSAVYANSSGYGIESHSSSNSGVYANGSVHGVEAYGGNSGVHGCGYTYGLYGQGGNYGIYAYGSQYSGYFEGAPMIIKSLPSGTIISVPNGLETGMLWLDTTDSSSDPILRVHQ